MTYEKLKNDACVMVTASKTLEAVAVIGLNTCEDEKMGDFLAHLISPALVLRAFSCELILTSLNVDNQNNIDNPSRINSLYHRLNEPTKDTIANAVIDKMQVHNPTYEITDFLLDLDNIANIFADWHCFIMRPYPLNNVFFENLFNVLIGYTLTT